MAFFKEYPKLFHPNTGFPVNRLMHDNTIRKMEHFGIFFKVDLGLTVIYGVYY